MGLISTYMIVVLGRMGMFGMYEYLGIIDFSCSLAEKSNWYFVFHVIFVKLSALLYSAALFPSGQINPQH